MDDAEAEAIPAAVRPIKRAQPFDVDLGARIRALRVAAGMSQAALGAVAGVSFQQMQKYERGKDRISAGTLFLFAGALNVPISSLFEGAPQHAPSRPARSGAGDALSARVVVLFQRIHDPGIRKQLVALAEALADGQARGAPEVAGPVRPAEPT